MLYVTNPAVGTEMVISHEVHKLFHRVLNSEEYFILFLTKYCENYKYVLLCTRIVQYSILRAVKHQNRKGFLDLIAFGIYFILLAHFSWNFSKLACYIYTKQELLKNLESNIIEDS